MPTPIFNQNSSKEQEINNVTGFQPSNVSPVGADIPKNNKLFNLVFKEDSHSG